MKFNGTQHRISKTGSPNKVIKEERSFTLNISVDLIDVTSKDSGGWAQYLGGLRGATGSVTGIIDYTEGSNEVSFKTLVTDAIARVPINIQFGSALTGFQTLTGDFFLSNVELTAEYESTAEFSADLTLTGAITPAIVA